MKKVIDVLNIELSRLKETELDTVETIKNFKKEVDFKEARLAECRDQIKQIETALGIL